MIDIPIIRQILFTHKGKEYTIIVINQPNREVSPWFEKFYKGAKITTAIELQNLPENDKQEIHYLLHR